MLVNVLNIGVACSGKQLKQPNYQAPALCANKPLLTTGVDDHRFLGDRVVARGWCQHSTMFYTPLY